MLVLMYSDIPLRFLVHYVGDMHQPLHLTGRDRGGNQGKVAWPVVMMSADMPAMFLFEGRHRK